MNLIRLGGLLLSASLLVEAALPAAVRLGSPDPPRARTCSCAVAMDCCLDGTCRMGEREGDAPKGRSLGPCRGGNPASSTEAPPDLLALLPSVSEEAAPSRPAVSRLLRPLRPEESLVSVDSPPPRRPA